MESVDLEDDEGQDAEICQDEADVGAISWISAKGLRREKESGASPRVLHGGFRT